MSRSERDLFGIAGLTSGLAGGAPVTGSSVAGELLVVPAQMVYLHIPATDLRNFVDGIFPSLAKNRIADSASGFGHRYRAGHDLALDVPRTFSAYGPHEGLRHASHILLTDFPTKAGIPIPGFSHAGLGHLLEQVGITSGWLQLSVFDTGIGLFAIADGASELKLALQGLLTMDATTALHTFGTGGIELSLAIMTENPLLLAGGLMDVLAGLVSTWNTFFVVVDPLDFFGSAGLSALLGLGLAYGLTGSSLSDAARAAIRSGTVGALYSVSSAFGAGAFAGFVASRLGSALAETHHAFLDARLSVDEHSYQLLIAALCSGNADVGKLLSRAAPRLIDSNRATPLRAASTDLPADTAGLSTAARSLECSPAKLDSPVRDLSATHATLSDDPPQLSSFYHRALLTV